MKLLCVLSLALVLASLVTGCKTIEPENASERPWNAQRGWEHGLPSTINQGR
jgi:hypothetical protein